MDRVVVVRRLAIGADDVREDAGPSRRVLQHMVVESPGQLLA